MTSGTATPLTTNPFPVLLGLPEGPIPADGDLDVYVTKLGGRPGWFPRRPTLPSLVSPTCANCGRLLFLVLQTYCPLESSPYDRVLYVWGCNRRRCGSVPGSWRVLRGHWLDKTYARRLEQEQGRRRKKRPENTPPKKGEQPAVVMRTAVSFKTHGSSAQAFGCSGGAALGAPPFGGTLGLPNGSSFALGDLWNPNVEVLPVAFNDTCENKSDKPMTDATQSDAEDDLDNFSNMEEAVADVVDQLAAVSLETLSPGLTYFPPIPSFRPYYLHVEEENSPSDEDTGSLTALARRAATDVNMNFDEEAAGGKGRRAGQGASWAAEKYEKAAFPRGMDKALQQFMRRLRKQPAQCVRYDAKILGGSGVPLLYSLADAVGRQIANRGSAAGLVPACARCLAPRVFECQLMPKVLSVLRTSEHVVPDEVAPDAPRSAGARELAAEDAFNVIWNADTGMEFGTVLIYTCERDCHIVSETADHEVGYFEEVALVQLEQH